MYCKWIYINLNKPRIVGGDLFLTIKSVYWDYGIAEKCKVVYFLFLKIHAFEHISLYHLEVGLKIFKKAPLRNLNSVWITLSIHAWVASSQKLSFQRWHFSYFFSGKVFWYVYQKKVQPPKSFFSWRQRISHSPCPCWRVAPWVHKHNFIFQESDTFPRGRT